jgi:hypothetical protein
MIGADLKVFVCNTGSNNVSPECMIVGRKEKKVTDYARQWGTEIVEETKETISG